MCEPMSPEAISKRVGTDYACKKLTPFEEAEFGPIARRTSRMRPPLMQSLGGPQYEYDAG